MLNFDFVKASNLNLKCKNKSVGGDIKGKKRLTKTAVMY